MSVPAGGVELAHGTAPSTHIVAAVITLLNQDRLAANKTTLGLFAPVLYGAWEQRASNFWDITEGLNGGECAQDSFSAAKGWDPLTGVGTIRFDRLRAYVAALP